LFVSFRATQPAKQGDARDRLTGSESLAPTSLGYPLRTDTAWHFMIGKPAVRLRKFVGKPL